MPIAEITRINNLYGMKCFEAEVIDGNKRYHIEVFLEDLKNHGIKTTLNGDKIAERWLNTTEAGQAYLSYKIGKRKTVAVPVVKFGRGRTGGVA